MKKLNLYQILISLIGSALLWTFSGNYRDALSFLAGCFVIWLGFAFWALGMGLIFRKKFIALSIGLIVFKYAILGVIIYWLVREAWLQPLWFALGVASFIVTALLYAVTVAVNEGKNDVI